MLYWPRSQFGWNGLFFRAALLLSCVAVFLQIAVFLQPLLPTQYQIAPVCETISRALLLKPVEHLSSHAEKHSTHQHELSSQHAVHNMQNTIIMMQVINANTVRYMAISCCRLI